MSLFYGPGWLPVTRKQEQDMPTKSLGPTFLLDKKSGQIVKKPPRMAVSEKIRQKKSKKVRVVRKTP